MRQLIALITLLGAFSASAQTSLPIDFPVGIRTLSTASGTCADGKTSVTVASQNAGTVAIDVSGTWTGTLAFYGSTKNGTYQSISATPIAGGSAVSNTTGNGTWFANAAGFVTVCAAFNGSAVTGSASVQLNASNAIIPAAGSGGGGGGGGVISGIVGVDGGTIQLLAGSALIGKIDVDQTTPGTTNGVVVNSSALPTGAATSANQGTMITALGSSVMQNSGGSVTANAGTNLNTSLLATHTDMVAAAASTATTYATPSLPVAQRPTTTATAPTTTTLNGSTPVKVFASTAGICQVTVCNEDASIVDTCGETNAVSTSAGLKIVAGSCYSEGPSYGGDVYCVSASGTPAVGVQATSCP